MPTSESPTQLTARNNDRRATSNY